MKKTSKYANKRKVSAMPKNSPVTQLYDQFATTLTAEESFEVQFPVRAAYDKLIRGVGDDGDVGIVHAAIDLCKAASSDLDPFVAESCEKATAAIKRTNERHEKTGRWGFDGPAIHEVREAVEIFEQICTTLKPLQLSALVIKALG